jgi:AhpD family alkylhydroperoxidase
MISRLNYNQLSSETVKAMFATEKSLAQSPVPKAIVDLVKIRVSQMNGCLLCLDMHHKEARLHGERELRLYHLSAWRESHLFSEIEKAALEWAETLTRPGIEGVGDALYAKLLTHFSEKELSDLTMAVASINAWNRLGIAFRGKPGSLDKILGLDKIGLE